MNEFTRTIINGLKTYIQKSRGNWNQNDETAVDYIKNRTHWTEVSSAAEILPETIVFINDGYEEISDNIILELGKTYNAIFNGTEYECAAWSNGDAILIGNGSIYGGKDISTGNIGGNGEPFSCDSSDDGTFYLNVSDSGTHTIKISYQGEIIHKIDKKYLPEFSSIKNVLDGSAEGSVRTIYSAPENYEYIMGECAFAEGCYTKASGNYSHAEGFSTIASSDRSHAEGHYTTASSSASHAEGSNTTASGAYSHAEGYNTTASGYASHAEGSGTIASGAYQHVQGKYNIEDTEDKYAHIVGNGTSASSRSNAHTLDWNGNAWFAGDVYVGGTSQDDGEKLVTESENNKPKPYIALIDSVNGYNYIIEMRNGNLVSRCGISSIKVTKLPDKVEYYVGEYINTTGMIVMGICQDGSSIELTNYTCSKPSVIGENEIIISYTESGKTYTTKFVVNAVEFDAATILVDFYYTANDDGTYTITGWKQTLNGVSSTEMIIPDINLIRV